MGYEYQKNNWEGYNEDAIIDKQPDAIITKKKLDRIEQGIERASMTLEAGNITTENENPSLSVTVDEISHTKKINIAFPKSSSGNATIDDNNTKKDSTWSSNKINDMFEGIYERLNDISYEPISIDSFSNNIGTAEKGAIFNMVTLNWSINKTPTKLTIEGEEIDPSLTTIKYPIMVGSNISFNLKATDEKGAISSKTTSISFLNGIYYGKSSIKTIETITSNFLLNELSKTLSSSYKKTFSVNSGLGEYIYFACPTSMGTPSFYVGGFEGGFNSLGTFEFTNSYGYKENYTVYISTNANLGGTTVEVK